MFRNSSLEMHAEMSEIAVINDNFNFAHVFYIIL